METAYSAIDVLATAVDEDTLKSEGNMHSTRSGLLKVIESCGSYPYRTFSDLDTKKKHLLLSDFPMLIMRLCITIDAFLVTRDLSIAPRTLKPPPVLPLQQQSLQPRYFYDLVEEQRNRLNHTLTIRGHDIIGDEFLNPCRYSSTLCGTHTNLFVYFKNRGRKWDRNIVCYVSSVPSQTSSGGLASVFSGTSVVESDKSFLNYEAHAHRRGLSNLSLAGNMHSKQSGQQDRLWTTVHHN